MYTAYNVPYGGVEPLRVWEGDISLSHVLSALGCTGEPNTHPLGAGFVYRIQSILTKAGKNALWKCESAQKSRQEYLTKLQAFAISKNPGNGQVRKPTLFEPAVGVYSHSLIDSAKIYRRELLST